MIDPERYEWDKDMARNDSEIFVHELIRRMKWKPNESILDYGCGPGVIANNFFLPIASKMNSHIYGVDNNPEMIQHAQLRFGAKYRLYKQLPSLQNINDELEEKQVQFLSFQLGDILNVFPFDTNMTFDKIFCIFVFHVIRNYREAINGLYRYLKPEGQMAFTIPSKTIYYKMYTMLLSNPKWKPIFQNLPNYIPDWMQKHEESVTKVFYSAFEQTGFKIIESKTVRREHTFESLDAAAEFGLSINPAIKFVEVAYLPKLKEEYRQLLINNSDRYTVKHMKEGGQAKIEYEILVMLLEKPNLEEERRKKYFPMPSTSKSAAIDRSSMDYAYYDDKPIIVSRSINV